MIVGLIYVGARFSLVMPDQALGRDTPLGTVWSWSNGNDWKLAFVLVAPMIIGEAALWLVTFWMDDKLADIVRLILSFPLVIFGVALLSCAYKDLRSWGRGEGFEGGRTTRRVAGQISKRVVEIVWAPSNSSRSDVSRL